MHGCGAPLHKGAREYLSEGSAYEILELFEPLEGSQAALPYECDQKAEGGESETEATRSISGKTNRGRYTYYWPFVLEVTLVKERRM